MGAIVIADSYPPLRQWLAQLKVDLETQKAVVLLLEQRLDLYEQLLQAALKEKEGHSEH